MHLTPSRDDDRIESWKAIAEYLGREVRTVQLWEKSEGLPVNRHLHNQRGSVWAYKSELDAWRMQRAARASLPDPAFITVTGELTRTEVTIEEEQIEPKTSRRTWMIAAGSAVAAVAGAAALFRPWRTTPSHPASLAILPFRAIGSAPPIGPGIADTLITRLGGMVGVTVRPMAAVKRFNDGADPLEAGRTLGVDAVLDGSVQQDGSRLRLAVQLLRVSDGKQLWGQTFDDDFTSVFAIQDHASTEIARALSSSFRADRRNHRITSDAEAYRLYLMGVSLAYKHNRAPALKGIEFLKHAVARDPNFALAHAAIAEAYGMAMATGAIDPAVARPEINSAAKTALSLDDQIANAYGALAHIQLFTAKRLDWEGTERLWRRALQLDPDIESGLDARGMQALAMEQFDLCLKDRLHIRDLDPTVPVNVMGVSWPLYYSGKYEESMVYTRRALELDPGFARGYNDLMIVHRLMGKQQEAAEFSL
jgi:TolB-like protein